MFDSESKLERALRAAVDAAPEEVSGLLRDVSEQRVASASEAALVVALLRRLPFPPSEDYWVSSTLHTAAAFLQTVAGEDAFRVFATDAVPELFRILAAEWHAALAEPAGHSKLRSNLMFLMKLLTLYSAEDGERPLVDAALSPGFEDEYLWSVIFPIVGKPGHPYQPAVVEGLRDPLPRGFARVAYLDLANSLAIAGELERHPFSSAEGIAQLEAWLSDPDQAHASYARTACAALPFVGDAATRLLPIARQHGEMSVQVEAAWAAVKAGDETGAAWLAEKCLDPRYALQASAYLQELELEEQIPEESNEPNFLAMAEMCTWLAHPAEFGKVPADITLFDTRELYWPPTDDSRRVWLFRYEYPPWEGEVEPRTGIGMVGSTTFALFGEATVDLSPEAVYALHCAWELEAEGDPRAPAERSIEAGMRILSQHNPGFAPN
ncbi:MAG: hypothetical protein R3B07_08385 [Polyangiaceae bacterium]